MTIYDFMGKHWFVTVVLAYLAFEAVIYPFKVLNRWIRHRNIAVQGWPPSHLDADGDWKPEPNPHD